MDNSGAFDVFSQVEETKGIVLVQVGDSRFPATAKITLVMPDR